MKQTRYSPRKEILLFLLTWPISALSLCILIMGTSFFYHFITDIKEFLTTTTQGVNTLIKIFLFLPYVIYKFVESVFFAMETIDSGSDNFMFNLLIQFDKYFMILGWMVALAVFYKRYYKNCSKEQLKKMKHPTLFYFTPIMIIAVCALFAGLFF